MKPRKEFKNFTKHLRRYLALSSSVFTLALIVNALFIIFQDARGDLITRVPVMVHGLVVFIAVMMLIMGIFYYRLLTKSDTK